MINGKFEKILLRFFICLFVFDALEYLGNDNSRKAEVFFVFDEIMENTMVDGISASQKVYPDTGVNEYHTLLARISSRFPSHRTLPSNFKILFLLALLSNSSRA